VDNCKVLSQSSSGRSEECSIRVHKEGGEGRGASIEIQRETSIIETKMLHFKNWNCHDRLYTALLFFISVLDIINVYSVENKKCNVLCN
jgi:hypothetical protein